MRRGRLTVVYLLLIKKHVSKGHLVVDELLLCEVYMK